ncbi:hypothetical protein CEXT_779431 [Caerostris extrusa]|uniref:Uncharacterized protein n=1 Tax=Caerostris extrusa TaxID=172846 RepID=A0AAV4XX15_CAEEX|nr:hypothetical protein CEXT_779431 [Caerostris extrusa]
MDVKVMGLHKSSTFSNFGNHKLGNWFSTLGHPRRKSNALKNSKSLMLAIKIYPLIANKGSTTEKYYKRRYSEVNERWKEEIPNERLIRSDAFHVRRIKPHVSELDCDLSFHDVDSPDTVMRF